MMTTNITTITITAIAINRDIITWCTITVDDDDDVVAVYFFL